MPNTARRRHQPQDRSGRPQASQGGRPGAGSTGRHGRDPRTAGASRTKTEIKRDFEYLLRLWETVRDLTLKSTAPTLVYEEGSLVKRSIRDLYNKDIDEILVAGPEAYRDARDFMRMLMPSHAKNVKPYTDSVPIFGRFGIESQLDAMFQPVVQPRPRRWRHRDQSGRGAGRDRRQFWAAPPANTISRIPRSRPSRCSTRSPGNCVCAIRRPDRHRLHRHGREAQQSHRRAPASSPGLEGPQARSRPHSGRPHSHFGLLEMSRQRIRSSVLESSTEKCPHCAAPAMRSVSSVALQLLRD